jgi:hypothetical protein
MTCSLLVHRHELRLRTISGASATPAGVLAEQLPAALADALGRLPAAVAEGVWFVRRLDVRASVGDGAGTHLAATVLARALVRELGRAADAADPDVLWFPDRAGFLARWLGDLLQARTATRWEYRGLGRLGSSGGSAAVSERAADEPGPMLLALRRLPRADLDALVATLVPADAAAVVHTICSGTVRTRASGVEFAHVVRRLIDTGRLPADPRRATLVTLLARTGELGVEDAAAARDLAQVALALRAGDASDRERLVAALAAGDWAAAVHLGGTDAVGALAHRPADERCAVLAALAASAPVGAAAAPDRDEPQRVHTDLGAVFLLLPLLAELPFAAAVEGWPPLRSRRPDSVPAAAGLALLALLGVLGADRFDVALADPWLRLGLGLPELGAAHLGEWLDGVDDLDSVGRAFAPVLGEDAEADRVDASLLLDPVLPRPAADAVRLASSGLVRALARRLAGMATASAEYLRRNVLAADAYVIAEEHRIVVELGHPPLNLLLTLAGLNRGSFTLDATGARPWVLTSAP